MKILTALQDPKTNEILKEKTKHNIIETDIQYQEGILETLEKNNKIDLINTIKPYASKFITKGICAETDTTIKNIETLKSNQENRQYTPRIIKDLKCAKKKKE